MRITLLEGDDYTIEPQKLPLPDNHEFAPILNPLYLAKKREEEKKAAILEEENGEDAVMKEDVIEEVPMVPPPKTVLINGVERKVSFDYYVHYVGH